MPASRKGAGKGGERPAQRRRPSRPAAKKAAPRARAVTPAGESAGAAETPVLGRTAEKPTAPPIASGAGRPEKRARPVAGGTIRIEQYRSGIGCISRQKRTLRALGLRHPRHVVARPDNPAVRGMVLAIPHLVRIVGGA